jgi:glycosyltransferase involved in cell wall biosynthesis
VTTHSIAVVIPTYNYGNYLAECLESLAAQTLEPAEVIVVDDGSTDDTREVFAAAKARLSPASSAWRLITQSHSGFAHSLTRGIAQTTADFVVHIDADDRILPDYLRRLGQALDADPSIAFAYPRMRLFGAEQGTFMTFPFNAGRLVWDTNFIPHIAMIRRSALWQTRGYRNLATHVDWDLWLSFLDAGHRGVLVDEVLYEWRRHPASMTMQPHRDRRRIRFQLLKLHKKAVVRHAASAPYWLTVATWRRLRSRLPGNPRYVRGPSCWIDQAVPRTRS